MSEKQFGRRGALAGAGLVAAGAAAGLGVISRNADEAPGGPDAGLPRARPDALEAHRLTEATAEVREFFGGLAGATVGESWRLEALYSVREGGIPVIMSAANGSRFAVEIFRASESGDGSPPATAGPLAIYVVDRGDGNQATDEAAGLGAMALGAALEARLADGAPIPQALGTLGERRQRHPAGIFHVPV